MSSSLSSLEASRGPVTAGAVEQAPPAAPESIRQHASAAMEPLAQHRELGLSDRWMVEAFELMLLARRISERALKLAMQGRKYRLGVSWKS